MLNKKNLLMVINCLMEKRFYMNKKENFKIVGSKIGENFSVFPSGSMSETGSDNRAKNSSSLVYELCIFFFFFFNFEGINFDFK